MFALRWTPTARRQYDGLEAAAHEAEAVPARTASTPQSPQQGLLKQVLKALRLLAGSPRHPGLRTHEYHSLRSPFDPKAKVFEAYAQNRTPGAYRIFWCYGPAKDEMTFIAITPHP